MGLHVRLVERKIMRGSLFSAPKGERKVSASNVGRILLLIISNMILVA